MGLREPAEDFAMKYGHMVCSDCALLGLPFCRETNGCAVEPVAVTIAPLIACRSCFGVLTMIDVCSPYTPVVK